MVERAKSCNSVAVRSQPDVSLLLLVTPGDYIYASKSLKVMFICDVYLAELNVSVSNTFVCPGALAAVILNAMEKSLWLVFMGTKGILTMKICYSYGIIRDLSIINKICQKC